VANARIVLNGGSRITASQVEDEFIRERPGTTDDDRFAGAPLFLTKD
jgi:hypothetical protein